MRHPAGNPWPGIVPAGLLMLGFFLIPVAATFVWSLEVEGGYGLGNYAEFLATPAYTDALGRSLVLALMVVAISSLLAWPLAWFLAFAVRASRRSVLLLLLVAPFWTSFTIRAFSWQLVLSDNGLVAWGLRWLTGLPVQLGILYTMTASVLGLSLFGVMLTTLMLYSVMATIDPRLLEAARSLGASPWAAFREVVLPLALPGWATGAALTFIIAVGDYAVPTLLGGGFKPVLAQLMLSVVKGTYDLATAATMAVLLMAVVAAGALPLLLLARRGVRLAA